MNSCLADLSRLIPPQYQRKGRGRIEKTEIIEMAIRHLKHLQNECQQKESDYRSGYMDCMKEAAKFLYDVHMQDFCHRLLGRLQEHIDEMFKSEYINYGVDRLWDKKTRLEDFLYKLLNPIYRPTYLPYRSIL